MNQWQVAALQPPHLSAMFVFEGAADYYRDMVYHGGILCTFGRALYGPAIVANQHGRGKRGYRSRITGDWVSGPDTLTEEELGSNRRDWYADCIEHRFVTDEFWTSRLPDFSKIKVPFLSAGNLGGQGLHLRGNVEGFLQSASEHKWLELHGLEHWTEYYTDYGVDLQKRFFGHFLKGEDTRLEHAAAGANPGAPSGRALRRAARARMATGAHAMDQALSRSTGRATAAASRGDDAARSPIAACRTESFSSRRPLQEDMEITGPIAVKLFVSSSTADADIFVVLRAFHPDLKELIFSGQTDPHTPIAQGWLRASRRKLDPARSLPYRPYHVHDEDQKLVPGGGLRARYRGVADLRGAAQGLSHRARDPRQRLRLWRRPRPRDRVPGRSSPASAVSVTTRRATGRRRSSTATSRCIAAAIAPRM